MKWLLSLYFVFMVLIRPVLPLVDYAVSYCYIITELCENRSRPQLFCNGKCYLVKELKRNHDTEKNDTPHSVVSSLLEAFLPNDVFSLDKPLEYCFQKDVINHGVSSLFKSSFYGEIFHPPLRWTFYEHI